VDGLHLLAGSINLIEIHANIWKGRCSQCQAVTLDTRKDLGLSPKCEECIGSLRSQVVWFGETLAPDLLQQAVETSENYDIMLVIGTSAVVQPAASFPVMAKRVGTLVAEINMEKTPLNGTIGISVFGNAGEIVL
jgi:NAD-dependent deacetylase